MPNQNNQAVFTNQMGHPVCSVVRVIWSRSVPVAFSLSSGQHPRRLRPRAADGPAVGAEERVRDGLHLLQEDLPLPREELRRRPGRPRQGTGIRTLRGMNRKLLPTII